MCATCCWCSASECCRRAERRLPTPHRWDETSGSSTTATPGRIPRTSRRNLNDAAALFAIVLDRLGVDWDRTIVYNYPVPTERSLALGRGPHPARGDAPPPRHARPIRMTELRPATTAPTSPPSARWSAPSEAHDRIPRVFPDDELEQDFASPDNEMRVAVRADNIVGWASIWHPPAPERLDRAQLFGEVAPEHRGTGIGRALMEWSVTRAQERFAARDHDLPCYMRINVYDWLDDRQRLYRRFEFDAVRWNDELIRPLHDIPPIPTVEGVTLRPWPDDRDEELRVVRNAAFADHWGSIVLAPDVWHDHAYGYGARPDLSVIAIDDATGSVIASCAKRVVPRRRGGHRSQGRLDREHRDATRVAGPRHRVCADALVTRRLRTRGLHPRTARRRHRQPHRRRPPLPQPRLRTQPPRDRLPARSPRPRRCVTQTVILTAESTHRCSAVRWSRGSSRRASRRRPRRAVRLAGRRRSPEP